jgi:pteridine reductase
MEISGRIALVTGGAHRVGRALSVALADAGMRVAINYNSAAAEADALVSELSARGHDCRAY